MSTGEGDADWAWVVATAVVVAVVLFHRSIASCCRCIVVSIPEIVIVVPHPLAVVLFYRARSSSYLACSNSGGYCCQLSCLSRPNSCCRLLSYCPPVVCFEPFRSQWGVIWAGGGAHIAGIAIANGTHIASRWFAAVLGVVGPGVLREMVVSGRLCAYKIIGDIHIGLTLAGSPSALKSVCSCQWLQSVHRAI